MMVYLMALTEDEVDLKWGTVRHYLMSPTPLLNTVAKTSVWRTKKYMLAVCFAGIFAHIVTYFLLHCQLEPLILFRRDFLTVMFLKLRNSFSKTKASFIFMLKEAKHSSFWRKQLVI